VTAQLRVGNGFDVHRWASAGSPRRLVLGGVRFDDVTGLDGHSDADPVAHACTDALLGAAGLGDIGSHFPDDDERWRGADSVALLAEAARLVRDAGWEPQNVDCTVVLDAPKVAPARAAMEACLSGAVGAPVSVKGKRSEGVGALGRGEGVVAWAVALVARPSA
jgi:2-C-methyl-D-erythritol 2,4-cyclodiphosphate synthase